MREAVLNALLSGSTYRDACEAAGIPWRTWCDWSKVWRAEGSHPDSDIDALITDARVAYAKASNAITAQVRIAGGKDWRAAAFLLEHRRGDPKARHDEKRARWEAEVARNRAKGDHVERVAVGGDVTAELAEKLRRALHGAGG
jgi:hypothetical protein